MKRTGKNMQITRIHELETRRSLKTGTRLQSAIRKMEVHHTAIIHENEHSYSPIRLNHMEVLGNQKKLPDAYLHRLHKHLECILQRTFGLHNWLLYMILLKRLHLLVSSPLHIWVIPPTWVIKIRIWIIYGSLKIVECIYLFCHMFWISVFMWAAHKIMIWHTADATNCYSRLLYSNLMHWYYYFFAKACQILSQNFQVFSQFFLFEQIHVEFQLTYQKHL
ncbi:uncharacterized protein LOC126621723 [Malus sylvestris]|uniref:uncharacterized protein LOC126621723 n=1 Tax=Malus sylvestris TaxID=3752 RepID=UPI0021AD1C02|nr:uncharacterized protein LOC126621723 [Malus sylvestris]XP_050146249.1 uncharacterized protein LOC126621723 [Malus sylvestris]XP_050146250.1 uncharacterized protein LOC126621723 [Malus sylvestris]XP_050146251.1 uncharacterized protein LOC126621723 [Malus sylvestris]XP_050146252.1 uncharacterized protein LOC126621723 [Malus sylvestris]XP_050146253.1 uncharacterized protein LOC126621723 [Malus sylvestris]XP_050146254.1 uncharacterized protein LOC126621723 [Malus sylvestris]